jgi:hypothetical protein
LFALNHTFKKAQLRVLWLGGQQLIHFNIRITQLACTQQATDLAVIISEGRTSRSKTSNSNQASAQNSAIEVG